MRFDKDLINRFATTYEFCDKDINKFILLLRKGVYPYEYMDSWKRFGERLLPNKKDFYNDLNMEGITEADYKHAKEVWKDLKIKNLSDYHDLLLKVTLYYLLIYSRILVINVLKYMDWILLTSYLHQD